MPDYAVYGVHFYGTAQYGLPPTFEFTLNYFRAEPIRYDRIKVEWGHPSGDWDRLRLVRGNYGFPTEYDDGRLLLEAAKDAVVGAATGLPVNAGTYEDYEIGELRFHYYTLWLRMTTTGDWRRAGDTVALMPLDYKYSDRLYELMPGVWRDHDIYISPTSGHGLLQTFLGVFGYELDKMRSDLESLRWTSDPQRMSGGLLPYMAQQLGFPYEAELGMGLVRKQLLNAVYLYKLKGSRLGVEGAVSVLTGWAPVITASAPGSVTIKLLAERVNQIVNPSAETDASWWTVTNGTLARDVTLAQYGTASFMLTAAATGDMTFASPAGGMKVTPGGNYTASLGVRKEAGTIRNLQTDILWYDAAGAPLTPSTGTELAQELGAWTRPSVTATAPTGAATAALRATIKAMDAAEVQFIDGILFERGGLGAYFDGSSGIPISDTLWEDIAHLSPSHFYYRRAIKNSRLVTRLPEFLPVGTTITFLYAEPL